MSFQKSWSGSGLVGRTLGPLAISTLLIVAPGKSALAEGRPAEATRSSIATDATRSFVSTRQGQRSARKARSPEGRASQEGEGASNFMFRRPRNVAANQQGKVVVLPFKNDDGYVAQQIAQLLDARGLEVLTTVRPVDTAEQYRDVATSMGLAAFVDGEIKGTEEKMRVLVRLRSGYSGRKVAEVTFTETHAKMPGQLSSKLWSRVGGTIARTCVDARKPRKKRHLLQINAGTALENASSTDARLAQRGE